MGFSVVHSDEVEQAGRNGQVRFIRRALGVSAFGINLYEIPAGEAGFEHDESESGQEEVSYVIRGSGKWLVSTGETKEHVPVSAGSFIRFDPETVRAPVAGPDGLTFLAVGCPPGSYEPRGNF
jgi:quercetin dioxygenase-like cupin family protein